MRYKPIGSACLIGILSAFSLAAEQQSSDQPTQAPAESLGDAAKKARSKKSQSAKRVFTDDDVTHRTDTTNSVGESADPEKIIQDMQRLIDERTSKTARQLSTEVAGQTTFPRRDDWERRLFAQHEKVVAAAQAVVNAAKRVRNGTNANERASAHTALDKLIGALNVQQDLQKQLVAEGVKDAAEWERRHP